MCYERYICREASPSLRATSLNLAMWSPCLSGRWSPPCRHDPFAATIGNTLFISEWTSVFVRACTKVAAEYAATSLAQSSAPERKSMRGRAGVGLYRVLVYIPLFLLVACFHNFLQILPLRSPFFPILIKNTSRPPISLS